jgi:hypothetical protein
MSYMRRDDTGSLRDFLRPYLLSQLLEQAFGQQKDMPVMFWLPDNKQHLPQLLAEQGRYARRCFCHGTAWSNLL